MKKIKEEQISNSADYLVKMQEPERYAVSIKGDSDYLYHRFNVEEYEKKSKAPKNSRQKKEFDLETLVYRDDKGYLSIPGVQFKSALVGAAKFKQDPRSPRKSASDLCKATILVTTLQASVNQKKWDYEDKRRVLVQRNAIPRVRPALRAGWEASFEVTSVMPEYIDHDFLYELCRNAGTFCGLGDFRPTYGRFYITNFKKLQAR